MKFYLRRWKYKITKNYLLLTKNKIGLQKLFDKHASDDYKQASEIMRGTLKRAVNENLRRDLKKIKVETLLIWGEKDTVVPVKAAIGMQKLIPNAGLVMLEGVGHFPYLEDAHSFDIIIKNYLEIT
jgi:pimeloyl-ACP methyl ester carboxylesterase